MLNRPLITTAALLLPLAAQTPAMAQSSPPQSTARTEQSPSIIQLWRLPVSESSGNVGWYDERNIAHDGDKVTFWLLTVYARDEPVSAGKMKARRWVRFRGYCTARTISPLFVEEADQAGKVVIRNTFANPVVTAPRKGTVIEMALDRACGRITPEPRDTFRPVYTAMAVQWSRDPASWAKVQAIQKSVSAPPVIRKPPPAKQR